METAMCYRVVGSAPFLKGDLIEHFHYGTRFKQKQVTTTHLHVKAGKQSVRREQDLCTILFTVLNICQMIIIYFWRKIPGAYFRHSLRELMLNVLLSSSSMSLKSWQRKKPGEPLLCKRWMFLAVMEVTLQLHGAHYFHLIHWRDLPGRAAKTSTVHVATSSNTRTLCGHMGGHHAALSEDTTCSSHPRSPPKPPPPVVFIDL